MFVVLFASFVVFLFPRPNKCLFGAVISDLRLCDCACLMTDIWCVCVVFPGCFRFLPFSGLARKLNGSAFFWGAPLKKATTCGCVLVAL